MQVIGYKAAHRRIVRAYGKASDYECMMCTDGQPASDWAYMHDDDAALTSYAPDSYGFAYSLDPDSYQPLCRSCHLKFDAHDEPHRRKHRNITVVSAT